MHNKLTSSCTRYKDTKIHRYKNVDDDDSDKQEAEADDDEEQHHHDDDNDELHGNALEDDNNYNDKSGAEQRGVSRGSVGVPGLKGT